ncbi:MAG: hypothetical protein Q9175_006021 [Cornicularia normoerica]
MCGIKSLSTHYSHNFLTLPSALKQSSKFFTTTFRNPTTFTTVTMKLSLQTLAFFLTLPSALGLTTPLFPVNVTSNATTTPLSNVNLTTNGTVTPLNRYYLPTRVKGYGNGDKNGLYGSGYHTSAGENDVTLESIDVPSVGYLTAPISNSTTTRISRGVW